LSQKAYVFYWLQGLSIIPDVAHTAPINTAKATQLNQHEELCVGSDGGIISGSVGSLYKFIKPQQQKNIKYDRKHSSSSSSSSDSSSRHSFASSRESSCDSINEATSSSHHNQHKKCVSSSEFIDFDEIADNPDSLLVNFKCSLSDEKEVEWKTLLVNGILYVDIPTSVLPDGSRDSFVSLLEFAEDKLDCEKVYVCFKRNRPDKTALMRVFMFFGFSVVPPNDKNVPQNDDIMSMVYNIE
jgi:ornithine decarboxylase antizyme 1